MNIRQQLLKKHSRANADLVESYVGSTPGAIIELMACFLGEETTVAQRAAQVVGNLGRHQPESLMPWWDEMIEAAQNPVHDAIRRNVARYFSELKVELPGKLEKKAVQSFTRWSVDESTPVAVAVFAMQFIADRCQKYPQNANSIAKTIKSRIETASPGFQNRGKKILKQMDPVRP